MLEDEFRPPQVHLRYEQALALKTESDWQQLRDISVLEALHAWFESLPNPNTRKNYISGFNKLIELGMVDPSMSLQQLALLNGEALLDRIKQVSHWSEATRQTRAACLLCFFRFLSRRTGGLIRKITPSREGNSRTFFKIREEVATPAMTQAQWMRWLEELRKISFRDWLIARVTLQGGRRISEVLQATTDNIDFPNRQILFVLSKTKGAVKETVVTYPQTVMNDLELYLSGRTGLVFITRGGRKVEHPNLYQVFVRAGLRARLPFRITPHVLRASCVTFLRHQGFADSEIMRLTGHASAEMIAAYDKRAKAENASQHVNLVS